MSTHSAHTTKLYRVGEVAQMSGTSVRTLHHYEAMGLLAPKHAKNGYRIYGPDDIERLQQILIYRACGLGLQHIKDLLDNPTFDPSTALRAHLQALSGRKQDIEKLIETVQKTINALEGAATMTDEERFEGLKQASVDTNERTYGKEARQRYGDEAVDAANKKLLSMNQETWQRKEALEQAIIEQLKAAMDTGNTASAEAAQLANMHAQWIQMQWADGTYSREAHLGLAAGYLADKRFQEYYDSRAGQGACEFLVTALQANL